MGDFPMKRRTALVGLLSAVGSWAASGSSLPDFSGTWELQVEASDFGAAPKPKGSLLRLRQTATHLEGDSVTSTGQTLPGNSGAPAQTRHRFVWTLDGKPSSNPYRGMSLVTTASWRGPVLQAKSKLEAQGNALTMVDQYTLSDDKRQLIIFRSLAGPNGEFEQKTVYVRVDAAKFPN